MARNEKLEKFIWQRQGALQNKASVVRSKMREIAEYFIPIREDMDDEFPDGFEMGNKIYDGTAVYSLKVRTDGLHGHLFSPSADWFRMEMERDELNRIPEVREWLQEIEQLIYKKLRNSRFYESIWMYLYDGGSMGTAYLLVEEDIATGKLIFQTLHPGTCYIEENEFGEVDLVHRKIKRTADWAEQRFGKDKLPQSTKDLLANNNPFAKETWIHALFPNRNYIETSLLAKDKKYSSIWMHEATGEIIKESGRDDFNIAVWRNIKNSDEVYGRSNAMYAFYDTKNLNVIAKTLAGAALLAVDKPRQAPAKLEGRVDWTPGGTTYYTDPNQKVEVIDPHVDFPVGIDREERRQRIIEQHFDVPFFLALTSIDKQMTKAEVLERQGEISIVLASSVNRLNTEGANKVLDLVFNIEARSGRLPPPPPAVLRLGGEPIRFQYISFLAQSQKRLFETRGIEQGLNMALPFLEMFPEARIKIKAMESIEQILRANGYPEKAINSEEEVEEIIARQNEKRRQDEEVARLNAGADTIQKLSQADKNTGNIVSRQLNQGVT